MVPNKIKVVERIKGNKVFFYPGSYKLLKQAARKENTTAERLFNKIVRDYLAKVNKMNSTKNFYGRKLKRICNGFVKTTEGQLTKCYGNFDEQFIAHVFHEPDTMRLTEFIFAKININAENKKIKALPREFMKDFEEDLEAMLE